MAEAAKSASGVVLVGDCLEIMGGMAAGCVDLVCTSPPYEDARLYRPLEYTLAGQDWVDWMIPRVVEMCRVSSGLVLVNMAGKRRDWKYSPVVEWLVTDLTRNHGIVCGPAPYVFYRIGIPGSGSGKYHRRDWEPVYAFARPENVPPKFTDNTALGHAPRWAPGGAMSNRLSDGSRVNQWGTSFDKGGPTTSDDGQVKKNSRKPSHVCVNGNGKAQKWGEGGRMPGTSNGDVERKPHDAPLEDDQPAIADPGNVIQATYTAEEVAKLLRDDGDVVKCLVGGGVMGDRNCHENEAPFPESLPTFFVRSYCPEGGTVLDPFCGSGTVLKVADLWGRKYIGIDARESQVKLSRKRLREHGHALFAGGVE